MDPTTIPLLLLSQSHGDTTMADIFALILIYFGVGFGLVWIINDPINGYNFSEKKHIRILQRLGLLFLWPLLILRGLIAMMIK